MKSSPASILLYYTQLAIYTKIGNTNDNNKDKPVFPIFKSHAPSIQGKNII